MTNDRGIRTDHRPDTYDTCRGGKGRRKSIETRTCKGVNGGENSSGENGKADLSYIGGGF